MEATLRRAGCAGLLAALLVLPGAPGAAAPGRFDFESTPGNLAKTVVPSRYRLQLDLDPARETFEGRVAIEIEVRQAVAEVVLHARGLQARHVELRQGRTVRALRQAGGPIGQSWSLAPVDAAPIVPGRYELAIDYSGRVNAAGEGLFRADHVVDGQPARMLATQLEAIDARSVLPAFDEPAFRAVFELSVRAPRGYAVYSNMPAAAGAPQADGDALLHRFEPTPPMPSYLLALSVGRFDTVSGSAAGVPLRILTAPGKAAQAAYALRVTEQVLPFFTEYFGVPYALPKLDQQAVPSTRSGAMEDWGLISYSEPTLLFDPARSSPATERQVYWVMAHEISHQWFGNLVTAASWEEIWLNEAFATWMADKAVAHFKPEWHSRLDRRLPIDETLLRDAGASTRPIRSGPVRETAVFDVFDDITYTKGGAVLEMLEQWLGPETFRQGLQSYMHERRFSNATAADLWFHIGRAGQRDASAIAASWTDQPGFPLVSVTSRCEAGQTRVELAQRRFGSDAPEAAPPASTALWQVPVVLAQGGQRRTVLLERARQPFAWPGCSAAPLIANAGGGGFYRVRYGDADRQRLIRDYLRLPAADQVTLLSDSFALAQFGEQPMADWFTLARRVPQVAGDARAPLFDQLVAQFRQLDQALAGTPAVALLQRTARGLFAPELERLGWTDRPGESPQSRKLRGTLIAQLARHDHRPTVERALRLHDRAEAGRGALPASIRAAVIEAVGMHADRARFDRLLAHLRNASGEEDRWIYARALAGGRNAQRARRLLVATLDGLTTPNVAVRLPGLVAERSPFAEMAYDHTLDHWDALARLAGDSFGTLHGLLPATAAPMPDRSRIAPMRAEQSRRVGADGDLAAAQAAANIQLLADLRERELPSLVALWSAAPARGGQRPPR